MNLPEIAIRRLSSQQIVDATKRNIRDLVNWMGAIQAQDYAMSKWAIGIRIENSTNIQIENAIDTGEIIRTHILRPTWHLVATEDVFWMLELTAPRIKTMIKSRNNQLELTEKVISKSNQILYRTLEKNESLTREELITALRTENIQTDENRASHLFLCAELDKIICSGKIKNNKQTYALFENRVQQKTWLNREEAVSTLAKRYFYSHGPATLPDFIWWSGLSVKEARLGLENIKSELVSETVDSQTYWFNTSISSAKIQNTNSVHLLPAYDEFLISYKDRSAAVMYNKQPHVISNNGIFRPVVVVNGQIVGLWKRIQKKDNIIIEIELFHKLTEIELNCISKHAELYGLYLAKRIEINFKFQT